MWDLYVLLITLIDFDLEIDEIFNSDVPRVLLIHITSSWQDVCI